MPSYAAVQLAVETRMAALWPDPSVAVRYENELRKIPSGEFVRLTIREGASNEVGYAGNNIRYRRPGIIWVQCFVEANTGTQRARVIADLVADVFEGQQFGGISCNEADIVSVGDDGEGFWQVNVKIFFDHDNDRSY